MARYTIFKGYSFGVCPHCKKNGLFAYKNPDGTPYVRCRLCEYEVDSEQAERDRQAAHIWFADGNA